MLMLYRSYFGIEHVCGFYKGDHNGNKFYNFLCYPRLFRQYVHTCDIYYYYIYIYVCSYYVLIIRAVRFCQINLKKVYSKQPIFGLTQDWFRELSFSRLECGVHDKLHISSADWWDVLLPLA